MLSLYQKRFYAAVGLNKSDQSKQKEWLKPIGFLFTIGWYIALSIVIPTMLGFWIDEPEQLNHRPLFTLIGFGVGTIVAFYGFYRISRQFYNQQNEKHKETGDK